MAIGSTSVPYRSNASTSWPGTGPAWLPGPLTTSDRQEEPREIVTARPAGLQVSSDSGVPFGRVLAGANEGDVHVQNRCRLVAADIARVGPQEPLQSVQLVHRRSPPGSRYPLATS